MKVQIKKFGEILTSRPAGREAGLAIKAYSKPRTGERTNRTRFYRRKLAVGPSWLDEVLTLLRDEYGKNRVICLPSDNSSVVESLKIIEKQHGKS